MSLAINPNTVVAVLLADGWHEVEPGTFDIDAYEYTDDGELLAGAGTGYQFTDGTALMYEIAGPLSAILAVRQAMP